MGGVVCNSLDGRRLYMLPCNCVGYGRDGEKYLKEIVQMCGNELGTCLHY
jgi:hypothetical protein